MLPDSSRYSPPNLKLCEPPAKLSLKKLSAPVYWLRRRLFSQCAAAADDHVGGEVLVARRFGVAVEAEVVAELPGAELGEHVLADRAVPLALVDPARRILQHRRIERDVHRRAARRLLLSVRLRLLLGAVLQVADELVVLVHLVGAPCRCS